MTRHSEVNQSQEEEDTQKHKGTGTKRGGKMKRAIKIPSLHNSLHKYLCFGLKLEGQESVSLSALHNLKMKRESPLDCSCSAKPRTLSITLSSTVH